MMKNRAPPARFPALQADLLAGLATRFDAL
jgi:hypothetical protein